MPSRETLLQDVLYSFRGFQSNPVFATAAILTLALGLGANAALVSIAYEALLRPLPYPEPHQLLWITDEFQKMRVSFVPHPTYFAWQQQNRTCAKMAAFLVDQNLDLTKAGTPQRVLAARISSGFLPLLGIDPALGRNFSAAEDRPKGPLVAMLDHALWVERFGANPHIVGKLIQLDAKAYSVIGVLPAELELPIPGPRPQIFVPLQLAPGIDPQSGFSFLNVIARLKPNLTPAAAAADLASIEHSFLPSYPGWFARYSHAMRLNVMPLDETFMRPVRAGLIVLLAVVLLLLLIACTNVAHLQLVRAIGRQREFSLRMILGARWSRLAQQVLVESLLLALIGGVLGLLVVRGSFPLLRFFVPAGLFQWHINEMGLPVFLIASHWHWWLDCCPDLLPSSVFQRRIIRSEKTIHTLPGPDSAIFSAIS